MRSSRHTIIVLPALALLCAVQALAQFPRPVATRGVDLQQKLRSQIPLDLVFHDETGQAVPLRTYFGDKPVLLSLVYFKCRSVCPVSMLETARTMSRLPMVPGKDYNVLIVSFDPQDTPQEAVEQKALYAKEFHKNGFAEGFHFLTGSQDSISKLTDAVGWRYVWDKQTKQFAHAAGIMIATPDGKLSRYLYGIAYASPDVRMGLVEASKGKIGSVADYVLLFCFHYDATQGKYTLAIFNLLKVAGALTVLGLGLLIFFLMRNEKRDKAQMSWKRIPHGS